MNLPKMLTSSQTRKRRNVVEFLKQNSFCWFCNNSSICLEVSKWINIRYTAQPVRPRHPIQLKLLLKDRISSYAIFVGLLLGGGANEM